MNLPSGKLEARESYSNFSKISLRYGLEGAQLKGLLA